MEGRKRKKIKFRGCERKAVRKEWTQDGRGSGAWKPNKREWALSSWRKSRLVDCLKVYACISISNCISYTTGIESNIGAT